MRVLTGYIIFLLSISSVFGQETEEVKLIEYSQSSCDKTSDPYRLKPRIISLEHNVDTLTIEVGLAMACCPEFIPMIKLARDTLYISYTVKKEECAACACCYSFKHKIKGIKTTEMVVKLYDQVIELSHEKYRTYEPTFQIVEGDTLNRKDKYGLKQGIWITSLGNSDFFYYNNDNLDGWGRISKEYYDNGKLRLECYKTYRGELIKCRQWTRTGREVKIQ